MPRLAICCTVGFVSVLLACNRTPSSRPRVNGSIESELQRIPAIDNHAHPMKVVSNGEEDHDYDALSMEGLQDLAMPACFREDNANFPAAWHVLFGYDFGDSKPEHMAQLDRLKEQVAKQKGDLYPSWVLNRTNTELMLANRVAMGRGLPNDRFKWVPFADMFLFPLNNSSMKTKDPDHKIFIEREEQLLTGYLNTAQLVRLPGSFDEYLTFVSHTLASWKANGAVAVKFELAYVRDLQIGSPQRESAERVYSIYSRSSEPTPDEYKLLQDYIFRYIAKEAGSLGLPVHIHCSLGGGSYFRDENANPFALEPVFNDPSLRRTKFVMLHGGWPFDREAAAVILKPNVYVDLSGFIYMTYPIQASRSVRRYLEAAPEKVLYGSDASPFSKHVGWEETAWLGSKNGHLAVGLALTGMMQDNEISLDRAKQIVRLVMRDNARQLYGF
jgi:uncharacterized protein